MLKNTMQENLRHWINFSFRSKQYFREMISRRILMQSLPFIFQFISIPSVLYFSVIQVFMMLFFPGCRHTSCKRKIKWDKTIKLLCLIICYIEVINQYGVMIPNWNVPGIQYYLLNMNSIISYCTWYFRLNILFCNCVGKNMIVTYVLVCDLAEDYAVDRYLRDRKRSYGSS